MSIVIFSISFFGAFVMVVSRLYELKAGREVFVSRLIARGDQLMGKVREALEIQISRLGQYCHRVILGFIISQVSRLVTYLNEVVGKKYFAFTESLYGRQVLQSRGSVSFFLQRISAEKRRVTVLDSSEGKSNK